MNQRREYIQKNLDSHVHTDNKPMLLHRFVTNSSFSGTWNNDLMTMEGLGVYKYPDGSHYRGQFKNGRFNGYGHLHLAPPSKFVFEGHFVNGNLVTIERMYFDDGLRIVAKIKNNLFNMDDWTYCTKHDRRYARELEDKLQPVGEHDNSTASSRPRNLGSGEYDIEEGVYKEDSGFVINRDPSLLDLTFVGCKENEEWIKKHCRRGIADLKLAEPDGKLSRQIIENNFIADLNYKTDEAGDCFHYKEKNPLIHATEFCKANDLEKTSLSTDINLSQLLENSSTSESSFSVKSLEENIDDMYLQKPDIDDADLQNVSYHNFSKEFRTSRF